MLLAHQTSLAITRTIQEALDQAHARGGGQVDIPPGTWGCGTLFLRSRTTLHLAPGAVLQAAADATLFPSVGPIPKPPYELRAFIRADGAEDVAITGQGVIDGGGAAPLSYAESVTRRDRPAMLLLRDCRRLQITGVTLRHADFWTCHLQRCEDVVVRGISIRNNPQRINTDGIDPDGCRRVVISDCTLVCGDDGIVLKSTEGDPCEDITITNCVISSTCAALKFGTESFGVIRRVAVSNLVIHDTRRAIGLYMKDGGTYERIRIANCIIEASHPFPIIVDITPRDWRKPGGGAIRQVELDGIQLTGPGRLYVQGLPGSPVEDLVVRNLSWRVTDTDEPEPTGKDHGAGETVRDPQALDLARVPAQVLVAHATGLVVEGLRLSRPAGAAPLARTLLHRHEAEVVWPGVVPVVDHP